MEQEDEKEALAEFGRMIRDTAQKAGLLIVERSTCPFCKGINLNAHIYAEIITCQHVECGKRYSSGVPRPTLPGEPKPEHYDMAIAAIHSASRKSIMEGLTVFSEDDWSDQPPEMQLLLKRLRATVTVRVCEKIAALSAEYAKRKMSDV